DLAIAQLRTVLEMEPYFPRARMLIFPYVQEGKYEDALTVLHRCEMLPGKQLLPAWDLCAYVYGKAGEKEKAHQAFTSLMLDSSAKHQAAFAYYIAVAEIGLGENQKALDYLERASSDRTISTGVGVDPTFDPVRNDPRFKKILQSMHLQ